MSIYYIRVQFSGYAKSTLTNYRTYMISLSTHLPSQNKDIFFKGALKKFFFLIHKDEVESK